VAKELKQIGEIAKEIGCTTRTIRYYEELGLITPAARSRGQFRLYDQEAGERIALIQKLNSLGFPLTSIRDMFSIRHGSKTGKEASRQVIQILYHQRDRLHKMIEQYQDMVKDVESAIELVAACFNCRAKPTKAKCQGCEVVTSRPEIPLSFKVIL
jgi:DNA-binding transcriptional MerR regulator